MTLAPVLCRRGVVSRVSQSVALSLAEAFWEIIDQEVATALRGAEMVTQQFAPIDCRLRRPAGPLQQGERPPPPRLPFIANSWNAWRAVNTSPPGTRLR